jgi:excinuclease UvrABC nuclease subunit
MRYISLLQSNSGAIAQQVLEVIQEFYLAGNADYMVFSKHSRQCIYYETTGTGHHCSTIPSA